VLARLKTALPPWMHDWLDVITPAVQILLIVAVALILHHLLRRLIFRASDHYQFPHELVKPINGVVRLFVLGGATLLVLERLGVSASVLWSAFTGFAAVGAVAFFAAWSVLSNIFCAFLICTAGPFRVGDHIELLDANTEKPGPQGRVIDINLLYITLEDTSAPPDERRWLQIPTPWSFSASCAAGTRVTTPRRPVPHPPRPHPPYQKNRSKTVPAPQVFPVVKRRKTVNLSPLAGAYRHRRGFHFYPFEKRLHEIPLAYPGWRHRPGQCVADVPRPRANQDRHGHSGHGSAHSVRRHDQGRGAHRR